MCIKRLISLILVLFFLPFFYINVIAVSFSPNMAKRIGPGPFAGGIMVSGDFVNSYSLTDDVVSFPYGTQISGNFYSNFDTSSGSVVLWWTPEYNYNASAGSGFHYLWYISSNYYLAYDYANDRYQLVIGGQTKTATSNIVAGASYNLVASWDTKNVLSGSNYICFTINDGTPGCGTTQPTVEAPASTIYIGTNGTNGASSGIIEGLTVYRRTLWDGSNGINTGNGDEVNLIYNTGTGQDPTLITGSWDVVFALPTNSSTGNLGVGGTGQAWSHPYSSNVLYTSTTNTGGFMMNGTYTADGWEGYGTGAGSITFDSQSSTLGLGSTAVSWSHTVASGDNRFLVVSVNYYNAMGRSVSSVTYNGDSLTKSNSRAQSGVYSDLWYMVTPDTGTNNVEVRMSNTTNTIVAGASSFFEVNQTSPVGIGSTASASSNSMSINVGSTENGVVFGTIMTYGGISAATLTPGADQTETYNTQVEGSTSWFTAVASRQAAGVGATSNFSYSSSKNVNWSSVAFGINPITGAGGTVSALATGEKIYSGGYKVTSSSVNQGLSYTLSDLAAGQNYVVRAIANSDGTSIPKVQIWDNTNNVEITSLTGTIGSGRTAPDDLLFAFELPTNARNGVTSDCTSIDVRLVNTQSSGTTYWHQVELLENLIDNPSLDIGSSDTGTWIPSGWYNEIGVDSGDTLYETTIKHSGLGSLESSTNHTNAEILAYHYGSSGLYNNKFGSIGAFLYGDGSGSVRASTWENDRAVYQSTLATEVNIQKTAVSWQSVFSAIRYVTDLPTWGTNGNGKLSYSDDFYSFLLSNVSLTATPASLANSTENRDEVRVDGRDTYIESSVSDITTTEGYLSFNWRPRHSGSGAVIFSENSDSDAYIVSLYGDSDDYINLYWDSANTIKLAYSIGGTTASSTWDGSSISANTRYLIEFRYTGGGDMIFSLNEDEKITLSSIPASFGTAPDDIYFGSDYSGANQGDASFTGLNYSGDAIMTFSIEAVNSGTLTNGITTNAASTYGTLPFGYLSIDSPIYLAHKLTVSTNAKQGYSVSMKLINYLQGNIPTNDIDEFAASGVTWNSPVAWTNPNGIVPNVSTAWIGANTSDTRIAGWESGSGKFGPVNSLSKVVMYSDHADVSGTSIYVTYAIETNYLQPTDLYTGTLIYNILPTY